MAPARDSEVLFSQLPQITSEATNFLTGIQAES